MVKQARPRLTLRDSKEAMRNLLVDHVLLYVALSRFTDANIEPPQELRDRLSKKSAKAVFERWSKPLQLTIVDSDFPYSAAYKGSAVFVLVTPQVIEEAHAGLDSITELCGVPVPPRIKNVSPEKS